MPEFDHDFVARILAGDRRSVAQAISAVENLDPSAVPLLRELFPHAGRAHVIGVTGSPGAGKSTLVEKLAVEYRRQGKSVAILAVDPTSPYSGGAILGDRIRMQRLARDPGVYIRSMATRGQMGGLAPTTYDAVTVLDAAGNEIILVETVGVGQDEVEVARLADATVLLLAPGLGDDIQTFKAGVMEIADLYVVNKSDRPGADRVGQEIAAMLSLGSRSDGWQPPILQTAATTGLGVDMLVGALDQFRAFGAKGDAQVLRRKEHWRSRVTDLAKQSLLEKVVAPTLKSEWLNQQIEKLVAHQTDPYKVVDEILAGLIPLRGQQGKALEPVAGVARIHHLGIAVESLTNAVPIFQKVIGHAPAPTEFVADQKVRVASFHLGETRLELLEGTAPDSPITKFIQKRGQGIHHIALSVGNLRTALERLESDGVQLIDQEPRQGADHEQVAFLHPSSTGGILIELVEET